MIRKLRDESLTDKFRSRYGATEETFMKWATLTFIVIVVIGSVACTPSSMTAGPPAIPVTRETTTPMPIETSPSIRPSKNSCVVDLDNNTHDCQRINVIDFLVVPENSQVVIQINLDPNQSEATKVRFDIEFHDELSKQSVNWSVNIGDSQSNDGWAGDARHQSNDAEVQIANYDLAVYGNDNTPPAITLDGLRNLVDVTDIVNESLNLTIEVGNEYVWWNNHAGETGELTSPYLFALNGQSDSEGPINYGIFAAFNRTIQAGRLGSGVSRVVITLL